MGMTIDKSIAELEVLKGNTFSYMPAHQSFITAIETMRKYQKIEQLIADYEEYKWERIEVSDIRRILDGNDD